MPGFNIKQIQEDLSDLKKDEAAEILLLAFREHFPDAWPTLADGREEVDDAISPEKIIFTAETVEERLVGWIGGVPEYNGNVWELHPLAVHPDYQGQGIGRALVEALEKEVKARGGLTIMLGTDDEDGSTSLAHKNLFENPLRELSEIQNFKQHPYTFYEKLGYLIVGVLPDANGPGKPDIYMAKSVRG